MIRVLVAGAAGRVGSEVVKAVSAAEGMEVVSAVDPGVSGCFVQDVHGSHIECATDLATAIEFEKPDVMVDFTRPDVVEGNLRIALAAGVDCVVGTTGLSEALLGELALLGPEGTCLFFAPNFAIGAVLMMQFAQKAARFMPHVEVIELHHDQKLDAPSGTAIRTAKMIAEARGASPASPGRETELPGMEGARGALVDGVSVHSIRLPGLVAHQEVLFGGQGQTLSIRHDTIDRTSFMPGVVLACREVGNNEGLVIGLEKLMGE
ncbi:MAG: 4-hydroxy-tetrahydrodipicolinate reductase [Actinobacteria bacterium HGW-Actinobacteria-7]|jgi:4-hydroxy-tetrahydrodipicolinate reductase|nr:MAG: 4-hydroxy-tetrahydrodipicolinate reductase [Actinobacteria bacterium HGW-Actinobacteria-7]